MPGRCTCNNPAQDGTPLQEGSRAKVIPPPNICLEPHIGFASVPIILVPPTQEYFGRDKDLKTLIKSLQSKNFSRKGDNVSNTLEEWIIEMEDYFALARYNLVAQGIMGKSKLSRLAKLQWKLNCQSWGECETSQHWNELKLRLKERYYPLNFETLKMNKFLACNQRGCSMDSYYEEFVKLSYCYASLMTEEQKISRFILQMGGMTQQMKLMLFGQPPQQML